MKQMNNKFTQIYLNAIVFKLQVILLNMEGSEKSESITHLAITHLAIGIGSKVTQYVVAMEKVAE